jgi:hypothetical protein
MTTLVIVGLISAGLGAWLCVRLGSRTRPLFTFAIWGLLLLVGVFARSWARTVGAYEGIVPALFILGIVLPALAGGVIGGVTGMRRRTRQMAAS